MENDPALEPSEEVVEVRKRKRWIFGAVFLFMLGLLAIAYWQRVGVADRVARDQLQKYGVKASYSIRDVGLRTQRLENIVIGDPANPDFKADWAEIDISLNFNGATITDVRAGGVWLRGRYDGSKVSFGELDKFSDPDSKEPLTLPDWDLALSDAVIRFETPWGVVGGALEGRGLLRHRFSGNLAIRAPNLEDGNCSTNDVRFDGKFLVDKRQPGIIGPVRAEQVACVNSGLAINSPRLDADIRLSEKFDRWFGNTDFAASLIKSGGIAFKNPRGALDFAGKAARTNFNFNLSQAGFDGEGLAIRQLSGEGKGHFDSIDSNNSVAAEGRMRFAGVSLDQSYVASVDSISKQTAGTPIGPLLSKLGPALRRAASDFDGNLRYDANMAFGGTSDIALDGVVLSSRYGARIEQNDVAHIKGQDGNWRLTTPISLAMSGGDLPSAKLAFEQRLDGLWSGNLVISKYAAKGASLDVPRLAFVAKGKGSWALDGQAHLSGPLPGGSVTGLVLPITGRLNGNNLALYETCQTLSFASARLSTLSLSKQSWRVCPVGGRPIFSTGSHGTHMVASLPKLRVTGSLGENPLLINSAALSFNLNDGFRASEVKLVLGQTGSETRFDLAGLTGKFNSAGMNGTLTGGNGQINNVPLMLSQAAGEWRYSNNIFDLDGSLRVADAAQDARFLPLTVPDVQLSLENSVISAIGTLHEPKTGRLVSDVDIRHDLRDTTGRALLSVDNLMFGSGFQPELLTPLTLGVVANVNGAVSGDGRIVWDADGVRSTGKFGTSNMSLAAAFGPVEGLTTEILFTDLLGLQTAEGQLAKIASVNPGIAALNGRISYQLLPGNRVKVEGGRWPFAGGELILDPTILDFDVSRPRLLTFRVVAMDAEKFLSAYEFENLRVSGIFDGYLPMVFDRDGGRIVGGSLKAREGGGELSYIGELSYEDMGTFANFAFNALKSIRYRDLEISVDGNIDGEIITKVSFSGVQQGSLAKRNFITKQLAKIPIQFNVSITAQFLQLIGSIRGLYDPNFMVPTQLPDLIANAKKEGPASQTDVVAPQPPTKAQDE